MSIPRFISQKARFQFLLGVVLGLSISFTWQLYMTYSVNTSVLLTLNHQQLSSVGTLHRCSPSNDVMMDSSNLGHERTGPIPDTHNHQDNDSLARRLYSQVRVACWILTSPRNLHRRAVHVKNTWGKRCNLLLFMSSEQDDDFPAIGLNVSEGRDHLTAKTMQAFMYLYHHHFNDADWFMKADDDTYVIVENLRYFLSEQNTNDPVYFGHRFKPLVEEGYPNGGAGYVLSKEALRRFGTKQNRSLCAEDFGPEDSEMGLCLKNLGVKMLPSLDALNRTRFHCLNADKMTSGDLPVWYSRYDMDGIKGGIENISDYAISFHYVNPSTMYKMEFYTYHLQPYGILNLPQDLNRQH